MTESNRLTAEQIEKVKRYISRINEVEGVVGPFSEEHLAIMTGTYKIIETLGNGDPIKAANERIRMVTKLESSY